MDLDSTLHFFGAQKQVFTRSGWQIPLPNPLLLQEEKRTIDLVRIRTNALVEEMSKNGKSNLRIRSVSNHQYNCVSMIFDNRRTWININQIYEILEHDGYYKTSKSKLHVADVVVYTLDTEPKHVGLVTHIYPSLGQIDNIRVLSKWGPDGEVEHNLDDVPVWCGRPTYFYSERVI